VGRSHTAKVKRDGIDDLCLFCVIFFDCLDDKGIASVSVFSKKVSDCFVVKGFLCILNEQKNSSSLLVYT